MRFSYLRGFGAGPAQYVIDPQLTFAPDQGNGDSWSVYNNVNYGRGGGCDARGAALRRPSAALISAATMKAQTESQSQDPAQQADYANFILTMQAAMTQVDQHSQFDQYHGPFGSTCARSDAQEAGLHDALNLMFGIIVKYANSAIPVTPQAGPVQPSASNTGWIQPPGTTVTPPPASIQAPVLTAAQQAVLAAAQNGGGSQQQLLAAQLAAQNTTLQNGGTQVQAQQSSDWVTSLLTQPGGGLSPVAIGVGIAAVLGLGYALLHKKAAPTAAA